jgi:hypothetical protein
MACDHPRDRWVGTESGICCGVCGAKVDLGAKPAPVKKAEPEPVKAEPKKAAPKKGGKND